MGRAGQRPRRWPRTSACLSPEPGARLAGQVFSAHSWLPPLLCPPRAVGGHRADCGLVSMATADEPASGGGRDCGGQELEGGGRARRWAALPAALWKRLPVPPRSHLLGSLAPGWGSALCWGDLFIPRVRHGHVPRAGQWARNPLRPGLSCSLRDYTPWEAGNRVIPVHCDRCCGRGRLGHDISP